MKNLSVTAAIVIAAVGVAAGFVGYKLLPDTHQATARVLVDRSAAPSSAPETSPEAAPVPELVPEIHMPDLQGKQRTLAEFAGQPRIINFWATWCGPCRREIPLLNALQHSHRQEKLQIIGIAVDFEKAVQEYVKKTHIDYPVLIGEDAGLDAAQKFGISDLVLPFSVFVDASNRVVAVKIGELHQPEVAFILLSIAQLDAGKSSLQDTRAAIQAELRNEAQQRAQAPAPAT
ncbi:MAG: TlpA disulfide reductase family protein [Steroidobacteraceae bacterium]|jgi:thiol-disulfide isomerase/thioredoxin